MDSLDISTMNLDAQYEIQCCILSGLLNLQKKVLIVGPMASGKSYLLERLKEKTASSDNSIEFIENIWEGDLSSFHVNKGMAIETQCMDDVADLLNISTEDLLISTDYIVKTRGRQLEIMKGKDYQEDNPLDIRFGGIRTFIEKNVLFPNEAATMLHITRQ